MKRENLIVILGGVIFLAIGLVITFNIIENREYKSSDISANISDNKTSNKVINDNVSNEENKVSEDNVVSDNNEEIKDNINNTTIKEEYVNNEVIDKKEEVIDKNSTNKNNANTNNTNNSNAITYSDKDTEVINSLNETLSKVKRNVSDSGFLDSAKGVFISVVDFLFYDGSISGVTFDELTDSGKRKVLEIASNIDSTIENKFPGYKDAISDKASNAFNKASEIIKSGAKDLNDFAREKLGEDNYQSIIDAKDELVYYTKNAINFIGDVSSSLWNSAKDKLDNWYQNFKNNN